MSQPELLKSCLNYFNQAQLSWDKYFSKWEVMAKEENIDELDKDYSSFKGIKYNVLKKKKSVKPKRHIKSAARTSRKNNKGKRKLTKKRKKVHCKTSNLEQGNEIIHKTENQTNLECEVVNNKHFEADLKAIFIEILSENTNKVGMFSVLSRMFPGNGNTISNISLSSVIMERNEFSINPVNNIILHSSAYNEFLLGGASPSRLTRVVSERKYSSVEFHSLPRIANESQVHLHSGGNLPFLNDSYVKQSRGLFHVENWLGKTTHRGRDPGEMADVIQTQKNENPQCSEGKSTISSSTSDWGSIFTNRQHSKTTVECTSRSTDTEKISLTSPKAILREILSPKLVQSAPPKSQHQKRKRKKADPLPSDTYDDSEDEKNNSDTDSSRRRFLKTFCTPKRSRRCINPKKNDSNAIIEESDDDECFHIIDRVKNIGTKSKDESKI